jgi:hypothetical protein
MLGALERAWELLDMTLTDPATQRSDPTSSRLASSSATTCSATTTSGPHPSRLIGTFLAFALAAHRDR